MNEKHHNILSSVRFARATIDDIVQLTRIMTKAFDDDAIKFKGDPNGGGPPGYDDGSFLMKWGFHGYAQCPPGHLYKIILETLKGYESIGAFVVFLGCDVGKPGYNILGTIFVSPEWQNQGVGSQAMQYIFSIFPAKRWELGTPEWATRNHHFYEKHGFVKIKEVLDSELDEENCAYSYIYERVMEGK